MQYHVLLKISNKIKKTKLFSIAIDSTFDTSHKKQVYFIIRYIDEDTRTIQEKLIRLGDTPKTTGNNLFQIFKKACLLNDLN